MTEKRMTQKRIVVLSCIFVGIGFLLFAWFQACSMTRKIENWVQVEGTVVDTEVLVYKGCGFEGGGYMAFLEVTYIYEGNYTLKASNIF